MPDPVTSKDLLGLFAEPPARIVKFFRDKGYQVSFNWREVWQEEHLRAFTVAKAVSDDVLGMLREGVDNAITAGWSEQRFLREMTPRLQAAGWWGKQMIRDPRTGKMVEAQLGSPWRLKTIYRTNASVAMSRGRYQTQKASTNRRPIWVYDARNDSLTRDAHRDMDNRAYRHDDPIWASIYPPNGYNCRCVVRALTEEEAQSQGLQLARGGELPPVEGFPDEGWSYNPGLESPEAFKQRLARPNPTLPKPKPPAPAPLPAVPSAPWEPLSTMKKPVTTDRLTQILDGIPGAGAEVAKLRRFFDSRRTGSLFLTVSETMPGYMKSSQADRVRERFQQYMSTRMAAPNGGSSVMDWTYRSKNASGYTSRSFNHVVVRMKANETLDQVRPAGLSGVIEEAIRVRREESHSRDYGQIPGRPGTSRRWRFTFSNLAGEQRDRTGEGASHFLDWIHEVGHQVHYWAGAPSYDLARAVTAYGATNSKELFAESFVAWVLNRKALLEWDRDLVEWIDNIVTQATGG